MKSARDGYQKLAQALPQTRFGKLAQAQFERLAKAYEKSVEATQQANPGKSSGPTAGKGTTLAPTFPTSGAGADGRGGLVPHRTKDGKIIYKRATD